METHGTATELGDRIELAAATAAFTTGGAPGTRIGIGSVKSNIGHLDAAAGVASFIKTVLMLEHATLAPTVSLTGPHPELALDASPFRVVDRTAPWPPPAEGPRRAGVSSLGIGGTNVHVVLEQAPHRPTPPAPQDAAPRRRRSSPSRPARNRRSPHWPHASRQPCAPPTPRPSPTPRTPCAPPAPPWTYARTSWQRTRRRRPTG